MKNNGFTFINVFGLDLGLATFMLRTGEKFLIGEESAAISERFMGCLLRYTNRYHQNSVYMFGRII
jgi:hypothetical protein